MDRLRVSSLLIVLANLIPLVGVLYFDWDVVKVLALFWLENVFIGFFAIIKVAIAERSLFKPLFFMVHYGGFMFGHGFMILFLYERQFEAAGKIGPVEDHLVHFLQEFSWLAAAALFLSHLWSFISNYIGNNEKQRLSGMQAMALPYRRMVITHVALLVGAFALDELGQPLIGMALLVALKIVLDVRLHLSEHRKLAQTSIELRS